MENFRRNIKSDGGEAIELPAYRVSFAEAKELARLHGIRSDLRYVGDATARLIELQTSGTRDGVGTRSLWTGAIVAYGRCFTSGRRKRLYEGQVFEGQLILLERHRKLIKLRGGHTAHPSSELEHLETGVVIADSGDWTVGAVNTFANAPPVEFVREFNETAAFVHGWVGRKAREVQEEVLTKAKALGEQKIRALPKVQGLFPKWNL